MVGIVDDSAEWKIAEFIYLEEKKKSRGKHKQAKGKETSQLTLNPTKVQELWSYHVLRIGEH